MKKKLFIFLCLLMLLTIHLPTKSYAQVYEFTSDTTWTVPSTGLYKIEVWGGQGGRGGDELDYDSDKGNWKLSSAGYEGERGYYNSGERLLYQGEQIQIYVGKKGGDGESGRRGWRDNGPNSNNGGAGGTGGAGYVNGQNGQKGSDRLEDNHGSRHNASGGGGGGGGSSRVLDIEAKGGRGGRGGGSANRPADTGFGGAGGGTGGVPQTTHSGDGKVVVTQLNSPPVLTISNPSVNQTISNSGTVTISGTVQDANNDSVTVSATIGGVTRSTTVTGTSSAKSWSLSWAGSALTQGSWNNIVVSANDGKGGTDTKTYTGTLMVDKTAPTVQFRNSGDTANFENRAWGNTDVIVKLKLSDSGGSGYKNSQYAWSTGTSTPSSGWSSLNTSANHNVTQTNNGTWYLHVRAYDNAGNVVNVYKGPYRIDKTAPAQPTINYGGGYSNGAWSTSNVSFTVANGSDSGGSGVAKSEYRIRTNGGSWGAWTTYSSAVSISTEGTTEIEIRTVDNAGNISSVRTGQVRIDKTAPSISVNGIVDGQTYTSSITPTFNATDSVSGVESVTATLDRNGNTTNFVSGTEIAQGGDYVLTVTARDKAGNSSEQVISFSIKPPQPILEIVKLTENTIEIKDNQTYSGGQVERRYSLVDELGVTVSTSPWTEDSNHEFTNVINNHKYNIKVDVRYK